MWVFLYPDLLLFMSIQMLRYTRMTKAYLFCLVSFCSTSVKLLEGPLLPMGSKRCSCNKCPIIHASIMIHWYLGQAGHLVMLLLPSMDILKYGVFNLFIIGLFLEYRVLTLTTSAWFFFTYNYVNCKSFPDLITHMNSYLILYWNLILMRNCHCRR